MASLTLVWVAATSGSTAVRTPRDLTIPPPLAQLVASGPRVIPLAPAPSDTDPDVPVAPPGPTKDPRAEPAVAVDQRDGHRVTVGMNDYDPSGSPVATLYSSQDAGRTFQGPTRWPLHGAAMSGDPSLASAPDGWVYFSFSRYAVPGSRAGIGGLVLARSGDGGRSWRKDLVTLASNDQSGSPGRCHFNDKSEVTTAGAGQVFVGWTDYDYDGGAGCADGSGPAYLARSTDHGAHFTKRLVSALNDDTVGVMPRVAPDGTLYVVYGRYDGSVPCGSLGAGEVVEVARSTDRGGSFTTSTATTVCLPDQPSLTLGTYRTRALPTMEVAADGTVVVAVTAQSGTQALTTVVRSRDHGRTWQRAATPAVQPGGQYQFPRLARGRGGEVLMAYLEQLPGGVFNCLLASSRTAAVSWSEPVVVSSEQSLGDEPHFVGLGANRDVASSYDGDYIGLAVGPDGVAHPAWTDLRGTSAPEENVWTRRVRT